ncbi:hypothetical protein SAMN05428966_103297 [Massilia sp. PDC64]|nr:hypothetical protein [Massilia sp. PDC64]SDD13684.1 hypothetical protein SAMN05428966_103297 [Massilia sp. PDC64]
MSKATFSARVFAIYVFAVSTVLVVAPNVLLSVFGIAPTHEVWIRLVGVLAFNIGIYAWVCAGSPAFLEASVYTRALVCAASVAFALLGFVSPLIVLFGLVDLAGGIWTWLALKADARAVGSVPAGLHANAQ